MAEALLTQLMDAAEVQSAGIEAADGLPPTKHAVSVMKELGFDIGAHRSRDIGSLNLAKFDLIVAMAPLIVQWLREAGVDPGRIAQLDVSDPYCSGLDVYRAAAKEIDRQLRSLVEKRYGGPDRK